MPISDEQVRLGYLLLLGREPESPQVYRLYRECSLAEFRRSVGGSPEGRKALRALMVDEGTPPDIDFERTVACFIHLEKTAGTTLHRVLESFHPSARVTPVHTSELASLSVAEICRYELISGHFDYHASQFVPAARVRRLSLFREPLRRLTSFYRFHRAHPPDARAGNEFVDLAHALTPARFFAHPALRRSPRTNNAYLRAFGTTSDHDVPSDESDAEVASAVDVARRRIESLDALGLTERMGESIALICRALGHRPPDRVEWMHRTDDLMRDDSRFSWVEPVEVTPDLLASVEPLVRHDRGLYAAAAAEFERRRASH